MIFILRAVIAIALIYNMWIGFRVIDEWAGTIAAVVSLLLFPVTAIFLPVLMLFFKSPVAGGLALWPGMIVISACLALIRRLQGRAI